MSGYVKTFPEQVYLVVGDINDAPLSYDEEMRSGEISWCSDKQFEFDVEYIRSDFFEKIKAEHDALKARIDGGVRPGAR